VSPSSNIVITLVVELSCVQMRGLKGGLESAVSPSSNSHHVSCRGCRVQMRETNPDCARDCAPFSCCFSPCCCAVRVPTVAAASVRRPVVSRGGCVCCRLLITNTAHAARTQQVPLQVAEAGVCVAGLDQYVYRLT